MSEQQIEPRVFNFMPDEAHEDAPVLIYLKETYNENAFKGMTPNILADFVVCKCMEALSRPADQENEIANDMIEAHNKLLLLRSMAEDQDLTVFDMKSFFNATLLKLAPEVREKWEAYKQTPADKDEIIGRSKERVLFGFSDSNKAHTWAVLANIQSNGNAYGIMKLDVGMYKVFTRFGNADKNKSNYDGLRYGCSVPIPKDATEATVIDMIKDMMIANGEKKIPPLRRKAFQPA